MPIDFNASADDDDDGFTPLDRNDFTTTVVDSGLLDAVERLNGALHRLTAALDDFDDDEVTLIDRDFFAALERLQSRAARLEPPSN